MDTMSYKGFTGSALYSSKDEVFHGKIEGIDALVNYEGDSVIELKQAFHEAVDYYLDFCKREGIEPRKKYSGTLNVRISPETHCQIATLASREGISINAFIKRALDNQVAVMEM